MSPMRLRALKLFVLSLSVVVLASCTKKSTDTASTSATANEILIGEVGSLTGSEASFGVSTKDGVQFAIDEINAQGGINGKKLRAIVIDNQGKPEEAATAVTKLITQDKVVAVLGEVASSRSLAMAPIAQSSQVPMISPASTNPKVTEVGDYIFRICFIDPFQGTVMANFANKSLKVKKAAILRDIKSDYSVGLANYFAQTFKKLGGEIVVDQSYSAGDVDFKSQLTSIKAKNPEAIFVPGYYTEVGLIARQTKELGIKAPLLGGDGWDSSKLVEIGGEALNGHYFSNHYAADDKSPRIQKFIREFKVKYNYVPDSMVVLAYDALLVLADAMKRSKSLSGPDLRQAIASTKDFAGITGKITLNEKRDAVKPAVVLRIQEGQYVFKEAVNPNG